VGTLGVDQHLLEDGDGGERLELAEDVGELVLEEGRVVLEAWAELGLQQKGSANSPSAMMAITSSPPTALSMKRARKRSWRGVLPLVLRRVARRAASCSGVTVTPAIVSCLCLLGGWMR
jgi:hypothetical protein